MVYDFLGSLSDAYSLKDLLSIFNISQDVLADLYKHVLRGAELNNIPGGYNLKKRFKHVYTECQRVNQAIGSLRTNDKIALGKLLDASHDSLSGDYNVSTPEIDTLVKMLKNFGALGARLVGAGFGGMILTLTDQLHAEELIEKVEKSFYSKHPDQNISECIIRCNTADGAGIM
jgi:galactokinase